jgi:hypothetical protein
MYLNIGMKREIPYRDNYEYFLRPWKTGYRGAERFANEALDGVDKNAIIYADSTTAYPILLVQEINGKREDVRIVSDYYKGENAPVFAEETIEQLMKNSAVYVVSPVEGYCPRFLLERYKFKEAGVLYRVTD